MCGASQSLPLSKIPTVSALAELMVNVLDFTSVFKRHQERTSVETVTVALRITLRNRSNPMSADCDSLIGWQH